ncbi:putative baseplate assembly protein [Bacillus sp. FJAT-26390]|uniref:putative baseplate assembly protein n=1 Tax=Bacillus sp. FJAT-26390 TaxID=1743142 RepID=UPI000807A870|nr:putative baseplate assembly protein [Bacillus sp. FJAT-26390]OBZ12266.1 putative baseplate assembly protein [Bacillus sp. FJAT-26390]
MLPRLPLDDRTYAEIVQQSRRLIPKRVPEWTDENAHDPGITFIELFAWLTEMQRYFIGRVPDKNRRRFLDLLGISPADAISAKAVVRFTNVTEPVTLPRGTKLMAEDQMFETDAPISLVPLALDRIVTRTEREANDVTATNDHANVAFYAFGKDAKTASKLYLSFDRELALFEEVTINVKLLDAGKDIHEEAEHKHIIDRSVISPSARLSWKAYCWDEASGTAGWLPVEITQDETLHLTISGKITFRVKSPMRTVTVHPASEYARYWICGTVEESGYEMPPRVRQLMLHTVEAEQKDTLSEIIDFTVKGEPNEAIHIDTYLAVFGQIRLQVRDAEGAWHYWQESADLDAMPQEDRPLPVYTLTRHASLDHVTIAFGDGRAGAVPPPGRSVRVIASETKFDLYRLVGRSNGLPNQTFELYNLSCKKRDALGLQIGVAEEDGTQKWEDWARVDEFDRSKPGDRHFVYDPIKRLISFGNGERGAIPPASLDTNIVLIACELGGGNRGNVKPHLISEWVNEAQKALQIGVSNPGFAAGGAEAETLQGTLQRAQAELKHTFRAVTNEDYETIAKATPGAAVARVHAIPLFTPGLADYPRETAAGQISVVVVPFGISETPVPSAGFLQTVKRHIDTRRLVTTEVHVIPPVYIKVTVNAVVVVEPQFVDEGQRLVEQLKRLLRPLDGEHGTKGWTFGRSVYKGDIYNALSMGSGVVYVQDLWIDAEGPHVRKSAGGDINLPPHGLVFSGEHEIELISRTHL